METDKLGEVWTKAFGDWKKQRTDERAKLQWFRPLDKDALKMVEDKGVSVRDYKEVLIPLGNRYNLEAMDKQILA